MANLPLVLMGPILRRVDGRWVCAFVAHSRAADVTAFGARATSDDPGTAASPAVNVGSPRRRTRPMGANQHAITVDGRPKSLRLGCASKMLPGFVTPAIEIEAIRLADTSCCKSHGHGPDGLAWLGTRIEAGLSDFTKAPHQLFLTGDQGSRGGQQ